MPGRCRLPEVGQQLGDPAVRVGVDPDQRGSDVGKRLHAAAVAAPLFHEFLYHAT